MKKLMLRFLWLPVILTLDVLVLIPTYLFTGMNGLNMVSGLLSKGFMASAYEL